MKKEKEFTEKYIDKELEKAVQPILELIKHYKENVMVIITSDGAQLVSVIKGV